MLEYVGFKSGLPLKILIGLVFEGNGLINLDQGLLILLLYPKVNVSSSVISKPIKEDSVQEITEKEMLEIVQFHFYLQILE